MNMWERVYEKVKEIPKGKVTTYGQIALAIGNPHLSQRVGQALHANKQQNNIPCYRVVNRFGELSQSYKFGGIEIQKMLLINDGVTVSDDNKVDLTKYLYKF